MKKIKAYHSVIFACTFLTGMTGLVFQVIWQKYLSYLVGSESRSISLVVAIFLFGLASGYFFWGKLTEKNLGRQKLLKIYGYIEFAIGAYAFLFANYYQVLENLAYSTPNNILSDMLIAILALFFPTFLMGATVPILTAVIPEDTQEINSCHAYVYGLNTLGAFLGVFLGAFLLIPNLGLTLSLFAAGSVNLVISFIFMGNRLTGQVEKKEDLPQIPNQFGYITIYVFVFIVGTISISFEVLFIRLLNLTIGAGRQVFPIVVGVFVLGLAIGSLSLYRKKVRTVSLLRTLVWISFFLVILYLTVPYWPYWIHNIRVSITSIPSNYYVFVVLVALFLALLSFPVLIPLGRLLPLGYFMIDKNGQDYGKICGRIYFYNTVGTMVGSIILGHLLLNYLQIDHIFKINIIIFGIISCFMIMRERKWFLLGIAALITSSVLIIPQWKRDSHYIGLFRHRTPQPYSFSGFLKTPKTIGNELVEYFEDGPNTTVTVLKSTKDHKLEFKSLIVNGKSDGNTSGDSPTITSLATLPYLFAGNKDNLSAAVIGLGTGITSGVLASSEDVASVTTLEISPKIINTVSLFDPFTNVLSKNPKSELLETDAFKFFSKGNHKFDIIVSEPSNPWVVGVENLFTPEFYLMVKKSLNQEGVFMQWLHFYAFTKEALLLVLENLIAVFPELKLFFLHTGDMGILAAKSQFNMSHLERRFHQETTQSFHEKIGIENIDQIFLQEIYTMKALKFIPTLTKSLGHKLDKPRLAHLAGKAFFQGKGASPLDLIDDQLKRWVIGTDRRYKVLARLNASDYKCNHISIDKFHCEQWNKIKTDFDIYNGKVKSYSLYQQVSKYRTLRQQGLIPPDIEFLESAINQVESSTTNQQEISLLIIQEFTEERYSQRAISLLDDFIDKGLVLQKHKSYILERITTTTDYINVFLETYNEMKQE